MKKTVVTLGILLLAGSPANALEGKIAFGNEVDIETTSDIRLFTFSDGLINAVGKCSPYQEDFTVLNPQIKEEMGAFLGGMDVKIPVNVKGLEKDKCRVDIRSLFGGRDGWRTDCSLSPEERSELVAAMKSKSTKPVTETFTSYATGTDSEGKETKIPVKTTMTDSLFMVTLSKITEASCSASEYTVPKEEQDEDKDTFLAFSDEFRESLRDCRPDAERKTFVFVSVTADILGREGDVCRIKYDDLEVKLPVSKAADIKKFKDLDAFIKSNPSAVSYTPEYLVDGLTSALADCKGKYKASSEMSYVKKTINVYENGNGDGCIADFKTTLTIGDKETEYKLGCSVPASFEKSVKAIAEQFNLGAGFSTNEKADNVLFEGLRQKGFCR